MIALADTHLTQFFLVIWAYSLPFVLVPAYQLGAHIFMSFIVIILFGMDSVAREIQDPFGFDDNDLNIQGYETGLLYNMEATIDGPLMVRTRDFASSSTHVRHAVGKGRLSEHQSGASELMGVEEMEAGLEQKENLWSLATLPWQIHGTYEDKSLAHSANKKNASKQRVRKQQQKSQSFNR